MEAQCQDCNHKMLITPDGMTQAVACENCGGQRLERDQPSPTKSDGQLRNMVDPDIGLDQGGNPLQEGIWGKTDGGWQPRHKRDESFARVAAPTHPYETYDAPAFEGRRDQALAQEYKKAEQIYLEQGWEAAQSYLTQALQENHDQNYAPKGINIPMVETEVASFGQDMKENHGGDAPSMWHNKRPEPKGDEPASALPEGHQLNWTPGMHGRGLLVDGQVHTWDAYDPDSIHETNDFGMQHGEYGEQLMAKHGVENDKIDYGSGVEIHPDGTVEPLTGRDTSQFTGVDSRLKEQAGDSSFTFGHYTHVPKGLNVEPYMPWAYEKIADSGPQHTATVTPGSAGIHNGTSKYLGFLDAHVNDVSVRNNPGQIVQQHGNPRHPEFRKPVTVAVHHPEHLEAAIELIETSASRPGPKMNEVGRGVAEGTHPAPPGIDPATINVPPRASSVHQAFLPALVGLAAPALMRGALMGAGSNAVKGVGNAIMGEEQTLPPAEAPRDVSQLAHVYADIETPHSNPGYFHDDPEKVDQQEFDSESTSTAFQNPNRDGQAGGAAVGEDEVRDQAGFGPNSPGMERAELLLPLLQHYYHSEDSAANDPMVRELHNILDQENPGYLDQVGPDHEQALKELIEEIKKPDSVTARLAQMPMQQGPQMMQPVVQQQPQIQGQTPGVGVPSQCPYCGGSQTADGSCPQCGAKVDPMGAAIPNAPNAGGSMPPNASTPMRTAADPNQQGPVTPEQMSAVTELLLEQGRQDEIPVMLQQPWDYAQELAEIAGRINRPPNVDSEEAAPPMPAQEEAPPGATMPMPNPADPSMQPMAKRAADAVGRRCPECGSATTGMLNANGDQRCHACHNVWSDENSVIDSEGAPPKIGADEKLPNENAMPAADKQKQRDISQEQDSSHTWQTDDGQPLQTGQEYEMHSMSYDIPDVVRVDAVKPNSLLVSTVGEYTNDPDQDLNYQYEITRQEVDLEQLTFVSGDSAAPDGSDLPIEAPADDLPTEQNAPQPQHDHDHHSSTCPKCNSAHIASSMTSPETEAFDCYRCSHAWEVKQSNDGSEMNADKRAWVLGGDDSDDDFFENFERIQSQRTAGKKFTPNEQREFIDEQGLARNSDLLDLTGTHYITHSTSEVSDDYFAFGL